MIKPVLATIVFIVAVIALAIAFDYAYRWSEYTLNAVQGVGKALAYPTTIATAVATQSPYTIVTTVVDTATSVQTIVGYQQATTTIETVSTVTPTVVESLYVTHAQRVQQNISWVVLFLAMAIFIVYAVHMKKR